MSNFPVKISPEVAKEIASLIHRKGKDGQFLRIGVKGGGCSGLEYLFMLDDKPKEGEYIFNQEGAEVRCDAKSAEFLKGATLLYTGNLIGGGFSFDNPNASRSCGCGTSFTPKKQA